nr:MULTISPECIES: hypothetical protein [unclassified Streptomyces]
MPTAPLDAFLPVRLEERAGDWGRIRCSNGWTAWVDARLLVSVPEDPPAAGRPLARTADPRPLIARAEDALGRYRRAAEELGARRLDGEQFRLRTRGLRVGMVVDGESVWLYDAEHERWVYCDGVGLSTYAAASAPSVTSTAPETARKEPVSGEPVSEEAVSEEAVSEEPAPEEADRVAYEPTRVVAEMPAGPPPTEVVAQEDVPAGPPPTRVVARPSRVDGER